MASLKHEKSPDPESLFIEAERYEESGNYKSAFNCLIAAARLGDSGSQLNLGNFYASGRGVSKSLEKAAYWYKNAYKNGERAGAMNLAIDRRNEGRIKSAVFWFGKAIAMNDGESCIELAKIYNARKNGRKAAASLLRRALLMSRNDISDAGKEEAEFLLKQWQA